MQARYPHPARPLRGRADLPTRWGGEIKLDTPTRRGRSAAGPTFPTRWGGDLQTSSILIRRVYKLSKPIGKFRNRNTLLLG